MTDDHSKPSIGKRIGEFSILGLYLVLDVLHVWPHHHFFALVAAVIGFAALLFLDGGFDGRQMAAILATVSAICMVIYFTAAPERSSETEVVGTLQPARDPTPPNVCDRLPADILGPNPLTILLGGNATVRRGVGKVTALAIGRPPNLCPALTMERTAAGIAVDADLFSSDGKLIARITGGKFHAIDGDNSYVERGGDLSTLIVKDSRGSEILYVRYLNPTTVRARGVFRCPGSRVFVVTDNAILDSARQGEIGGNCTVDPGGPAVVLN